jgi:hypothetical protein
MESRVELFAAIRRDARVEGLSIRGVGGPAWGAPPHGAAGAGVRGTADAEGAGVAIAAVGPVPGGDRRHAAVGSGGAA